MDWDITSGTWGIIIGGLSGLGIGLSALSIYRNYREGKEERRRQAENEKEQMQPAALQTRQIEGDSNEYLVLELKDGSHIPFVKQADGNYVRLDTAHQTQEKGLAEKLGG